MKSRANGDDANSILQSHGTQELLNHFNSAFTADAKTEEASHLNDECRRSHLDILLDISQTATLFHSPDGTAFADVYIGGHRQTWAIRSSQFRSWLRLEFLKLTRSAPSPQALQSALETLKARAEFDSPERTVHLRVGELDGIFYLDLGDATWRAIAISSAGWSVIDSPPIRFRRSKSTGPLPEPQRGGSVNALRRFLNVASDEDFVLTVACVLGYLRSRGPYPLLVLSGEQGSSKSTFSEILKALLDPNKAPLRALPRNEHELFISAENSRILVFDNVSGIAVWLSDGLCRIATGGGFSTRQLFSDLEEVIFDVSRPIILNGIEDTITRADLADRSIFIALEPIPDEMRMSQAAMRTAFDAARPKILGALLDAMVVGLQRLPLTNLPKLPRMADFAIWATACETALWPTGTFEKAYNANRAAVVDCVIDADPVSNAIRSLIKSRPYGWQGTATQLLTDLEKDVPAAERKGKGWPDSSRALSGRLRRALTFLRKSGISVCFKKVGHWRTRMIHIEPISADLHSASSASSASSTPSFQDDSDIPSTRSKECDAEPISYAQEELADGADGADGIAESYHPQAQSRLRGFTDEA